MPSVDYAAGALGDRSIETAEADPAVIYALDADLRITYCKPAWDAFARANNGGHLVRPHQIGFTLMYAIPGCLREFYRQAFQSVGDREQPWEQISECSSPTVYRACEMTIQPIAKRAGFLVISRLVIERPHAADHAPHLPLVELYA